MNYALQAASRSVVKPGYAPIEMILLQGSCLLFWKTQFAVRSFCLYRNSLEFFKTIHMAIPKPTAFVTEAVIDDVVEQLDADAQAIPQATLDMEKEQPVLWSWFFSENFDLFTPDERAYLQYLALVIWKASCQVLGPRAAVNEEQISQAEDHNWAMLEGVKSHIFRERMTVFFEHYPQEDLLAFVEDALLDDEDTIVTAEGREALFVTLKTVIDLLAVAA